MDVKRAESLNSGDSFTDIMSYVRNNAAAWQLSLFFHYRMHSLTCTQQPMEQGRYTTETPGVAREN